MGKPDALSRRSDHGTSANDNSDVVLLTPKLFAVRALEGSSPDQNRTSYKTSGRGLSSQRRNPSPEPRRNYESRPPTPSDPRWSERDSLLYYCGCIYVLDTSDLCRRIVSLCHDTKVAGHPGRFKTLELIS